MMTPPVLPDGPFRWRDAEKAGFTRRHLDDLLLSRRVRRVLHGVYQRAEIPDTLENRVAAAALVLRPFGVMCDQTAAWLHGVDTFDYRELEILPRLETFVLRSYSRTRRKGCRGGERDLKGCDICLIGVVKVTTPLRTALDLGCKLSRRSALAALEGFMRECGVTRGEMLAELPRYRRRRGVVQLRELVPLADERSESPGESWTRISIIDAGLPVPTPQHWVYVNGRKTYRLDLAYPRSRVVVEYDGREFHESARRKAADRRRRTWLRNHGWIVIVVDKQSFTPEALSSWIQELRIALRIGV